MVLLQRPKNDAHCPHFSNSIIPLSICFALTGLDVEIDSPNRMKLRDAVPDESSEL